MISLKLTGFAALFLSLSISTAAQSQSSGAEEWGEAVEGVQIRLAMAAQLATPQIPPLEVLIRNRGTSAVTYVAEALSGRPAIEIDGVWYSVAGGGSCCSNPQTVAPGSQSSALPLRLQGKTLLELDGKGAPSGKQLSVLQPGKHSLRIRTFSNDRINVTVQGPAAHGIVLLSNTITFELLTSQALVGQPVRPEIGALALDTAKACITKSPADFRSVWGSPLNFATASVGTRAEADRVNVFISETSARGKPQGVAIDVNTRTGACINFTNRLE